MRTAWGGIMVGAMVGFIARGMVVGLNLPDNGVLILLALPSAVIGALVGGIAGATAKPIRGAIVGAVLSGLVFEFFVIAVTGLFGGAERGVAETFVYALQMALAGAIAGGLGGLVGMQERLSDPKASAPLQAASSDYQQVVGSNCANCQQRIASAMDATHCPSCKQPLHFRCGYSTDAKQGAFLCTTCRGS